MIEVRRRDDGHWTHPFTCYLDGPLAVVFERNNKILRRWVYRLERELWIMASRRSRC